MRTSILAAAILAVIAASARPAEVTVTQIKASGSGGKPVIDSRLSDIRDKLEKQFKFARYDLLARDTDTIATGDTSTLQLKTGDYLDMTIDAEEADSAGNVRQTMSVEVYRKTQRGRESISKLTVKNPSGGTFLIVLPVSKEIDGTPIIAIRTK